MKRLLTEPLLHFLVLGAALFGLFNLVGKKETEQPAAIVVSAARIENLANGFARTWQRPPTTQELRGLIDDHVRDEVFYREGKALGLDRDDIVIRRRLRQKMEFMAEDMGAEDAQRLGLLSKVVARDDLMDTALEVANHLATGPAATMRFAKRAVYKALTLDLEQSMEYVGYARRLVASSGEGSEGTRSYLEKRAANFIP